MFEMNKSTYNDKRFKIIRERNIDYIKTSKNNIKEILDDLNCPHDMGYENKQCSSISCNQCVSVFAHMILKTIKKSNVK